MRGEFVLALGIVVVLLVLRFRERRSISGRILQLMSSEESMEANKAELERLIAEQGAEEKARRARLWEEAHTSRRAGRKLRRALEDELKMLEEMRKEVSADTENAEVHQLLDNDRRDIQQQLDRLAALMQQMGS